jgi:hypothetical protein
VTPRLPQRGGLSSGTGKRVALEGQRRNRPLPGAARLLAVLPGTRGCNRRLWPCTPLERRAPRPLVAHARGSRLPPVAARSSRSGAHERCPTHERHARPGCSDRAGGSHPTPTNPNRPSRAAPLLCSQHPPSHAPTPDPTPPHPNQPQPTSRACAAALLAAAPPLFSVSAPRQAAQAVRATTFGSSSRVARAFCATGGQPPPVCLRAPLYEAPIVIVHTLVCTTCSCLRSSAHARPPDRGPVQWRGA